MQSILQHTFAHIFSLSHNTIVMEKIYIERTSKQTNVKERKRFVCMWCIYTSAQIACEDSTRSTHTHTHIYIYNFIYIYIY